MPRLTWSLATSARSRFANIVHLTPTSISRTFATYGVAGVVGNFVGERVTAWNLKAGFVASALLMGVSLALAFLADGRAFEAVALVVLWYVAFGAVPVCVQICAYRSATSQFETSSALMVTVLSGGRGSRQWRLEIVGTPK